MRLDLSEFETFEHECSGGWFGCDLPSATIEKHDADVYLYSGTTTQRQLLPDEAERMRELFSEVSVTPVLFNIVLYSDVSITSLRWDDFAARDLNVVTGMQVLWEDAAAIREFLMTLESDSE